MLSASNVPLKLVEYIAAVSRQYLPVRELARCRRTMSKFTTTDKAEQQRYTLRAAGATMRRFHCGPFNSVDSIPLSLGRYSDAHLPAWPWPS